MQATPNAMILAAISVSGDNLFGGTDDILQHNLIADPNKPEEVKIDAERLCWKVPITGHPSMCKARCRTRIQWLQVTRSVRHVKTWWALTATITPRKFVAKAHFLGSPLNTKSSCITTFITYL